VKQQHSIKKCVDVITNTNKELKILYADKDKILQDELMSLRGNNMFKSFYENLNNIREHHVKYPSNHADTLSSIPTVGIDDIERHMFFSGEEVFGKYLDLNELFFSYCNIPNISSSEQVYLQYLDKFNSFFHIPESVKSSKQYKYYVEALWTYLSTFFAKIQPLVEIDILIKDWKSDFDEKWISGKVLGWKLKEGSVRKGDPQPLRLGMFNSVEELEALGIDRLKEGLEALGLKCGGTLRDRASRLWSVRGQKAENIPDKLKAKPSAGLDGAISGSKRKFDDIQEDKRKELAWMECKIISICEMMMDVITLTRRHAAKQQTRTMEEKEMELYEEEFGTNQDLVDLTKSGNDEDEDEPIYNPLNLPLGWDGKPIPYWLYKLHGLGVEYKCEICGNQSYWGRRNFDRHFQEVQSRHYIIMYE